MKPITVFTPSVCKEVRGAIDKALLDVERKFGLKIKSARGKYRDALFTLSVEAAIVDANGNDLSGKNDFERYAEMFELKPEYYGKTFTAQGEEYRIVGLNLRADKMPVKCVRVSDGRPFKFATKGIKLFFASKEAA